MCSSDLACQGVAEAVALPARPSVAEVSSFKGDFAEVLLRSLDAGTVHVIDPWAGTVVSGNQDGNDLLAAEGDRLYEFVRARFAFREGAAGCVRRRTAASKKLRRRAGARPAPATRTARGWPPASTARSPRGHGRRRA